LDPQKTSYGFGYSSLWSLAGLIHSTDGIVPFASSSPDGTLASDVALVIIILNIEKGVVSVTKWSSQA
jgi:hypothetical protein